MEFGAPALKPRPGRAIPARLARDLARDLSLARPLVFLDLESTGLDPRADRIVEIALARIGPDGEVDSLDSLVYPGIAMPPEVERIHGIGDSDVAEAPAFADLAADVGRLLRGADLAGYNLLWFDLPLLAAELERAGLELDWQRRRIIDVCTVFKRKERRDLASAYRFFCQEQLPDAHTATGDVIATVEVLAGQLRRYDDLPRSVEGLDSFVRDHRRRR